MNCPVCGTSMPAQAKFCSQCGSPRAAPLGSVPLRPPRSPQASNAATRWLLAGAALVVVAAGWLAFNPSLLPTGGDAGSPAADAPTDASKAATLVGPQGAAGVAGTGPAPDQPPAVTAAAVPVTPPAAAGAAPAAPAPAVAANPPPTTRPATTPAAVPVAAAPAAPGAAAKAVPPPAVSGPMALPPSPSPSTSPAAPRPAPKDAPTLNDLLD